MNDQDLMRLALSEARLALKHDDVPVGAIVVHDSEVIASRHNERELHQDPSAHAEALALKDAAQHLGRWRLDDCTLIVTLEPCLACAGISLNARIQRIVFGAHDEKAGACGSLYNVCVDPRLNHEMALSAGVLATESAQLLRSFFSARR
jgi:tRNA(adenine34) deaminase